MEIVILYAECDDLSDICDVIFSRKFEISPCHVIIICRYIKWWSAQTKVHKSKSDA